MISRSQVHSPRPFVFCSVLAALWLAPARAFATEEVIKDPKGEAEIHAVKAKTLADQKNWQGARDEAETAATLDPSRADAWLILGTAEQRLDHEAEAVRAFRVYLGTNPPEEKAAVVRARVGELEVAAENRKRKSDEESRTRYGTDGVGIGIGLSPVYSIKAGSDAGDLNSGLSSSTDVFLGTGWFGLGYRFASGTVPTANIQETVIVTNIVTNVADKPTVTNTAATKLDHSLGELYLQGTIPLNEPYGRWGGFQGFVPAYLGMPWNKVSSGGVTYQGIGLDVATGVGVRYFTKTMFTANLTLLYHFVSMNTDISNHDGTIGNTSDVKVVQTADRSTAMKGAVTGFEIRLGVTLLLPQAKTE